MRSTKQEKICQAFSKGLRVPNKREIFDHCWEQFHLSKRYQRRMRHPSKNGKGGEYAAEDMQPTREEQGTPGISAEIDQQFAQTEWEEQAGEDVKPVLCWT